MHKYIIVHHTTLDFIVALFEKNHCIKKHQQEKRSINSSLIPVLDAILTDTSITLRDISFIGINQGPGSFSTLRSLIATVNGLHYAANIPLVGVDALEATGLEYKNNRYDYTVTLFNAYNNELYYRIDHQAEFIQSGYCTLQNLFSILEKVPSGKFYCIGDGAELYKEAIVSHPTLACIVPENIPSICSLDMVSQLAYEKYKNGNREGYLFPLHLKKHAVEL
jgi:tRNA threonylcarbamoyladenosine biosynthesis protein TsaB